MKNTWKQTFQRLRVKDCGCVLFQVRVIFGSEHAEEIQTGVIAGILEDGKRKQGMLWANSKDKLLLHLLGP